MRPSQVTLVAKNSFVLGAAPSTTPSNTTSTEKHSHHTYLLATDRSVSLLDGSRSEINTAVIGAELAALTKAASASDTSSLPKIAPRVWAPCTTDTSSVTPRYGPSVLPMSGGNFLPADVFSISGLNGTAKCARRIKTYQGCHSGYGSVGGMFMDDMVMEGK